MDKAKIIEFLYMTLPVMITCFFVIVLTAICNIRWLIILVQLPAWAALLWWLYMTKEIYNGLLDEIR